MKDIYALKFFLRKRLKKAKLVLKKNNAIWPEIFQYANVDVDVACLPLLQYYAISADSLWKKTKNNEEKMSI